VLRSSQSAGRTFAWLEDGCQHGWRADERHSILLDMDASTRPSQDILGNDTIQVAVVDDHALIRLGVQSAIDAEPGLACVAVMASGDELGSSDARPDVVVLDYHLPRVNGLELCRRTKLGELAPAVVLYSAYADPALVVPALVAGADAIVHKGAPARELLAAIHAVAGGGRRLPPLSPALLEAAGTMLDADDLPILGMLVAGTDRGEIAATMRLDTGEFEQRVDAMVARLRPVPRMARRGSD